MARAHCLLLTKLSTRAHYRGCGFARTSKSFPQPRPFESTETTGVSSTRFASADLANGGRSCVGPLPPPRRRRGKCCCLDPLRGGGGSGGATSAPSCARSPSSAQRHDSSLSPFPLFGPDLCRRCCHRYTPRKNICPKHVTEYRLDKERSAENFEGYGISCLSKIAAWIYPSSLSDVLGNKRMNYKYKREPIF